MTLNQRSAALLAFLGSAAAGLAQPNVRSIGNSCIQSGCVTWSVAPRSGASTTYDITITTDREDSTVVHIYNTNFAYNIGNITVHYTGDLGVSPQIVLFVNGSSSDHLSTTPMPTSILGQVRRDTGSRDGQPLITLSICRVAGTFGGCSSLDNVNTLVVGGDVTGPITLGPSLNGNPSLGLTGGVTIGGNLLANITVNGGGTGGTFSGEIGSLTISGSVNSSQTITARSVATLLKVVGSNDATINITNDVARFDGSNFTGTLRCRDFGVTAASSTSA